MELSEELRQLHDSGDCGQMVEGMSERAAKQEDLLEMAWVLIANGSDGDWDKAHPDWKKAAAKWRDDYHS